MPKTKCGHPSCNCMVESGKQYCSDACKELADTQGRELRCSCEHKDCAAKSH